MNDSENIFFNQLLTSTYLIGYITDKIGDKMMEYLFGNKNTEKILVFLKLHKKAHASELSKLFNSSLDPIQKTLKKLESGGLLVSFLEGKTRVFQWNPRYPFLNEIQNLADKIYSFIPPEMQVQQYQKLKRKRPRKTGKPL